MLGLSDRRVRQLNQEGVIDRCEDGTYDIREVVEQYYRFKYEAVEGAESYEAERAKHEVIKRKLSELKLKKSEGELTELTHVMDVMSSMATEIRTQMLAIPQRVSPKLISKTRIVEIADIIRAEIEEVLGYLASIDKSNFVDTEEGVDDYEPEQATESGKPSLEPVKASTKNKRK